MAEFISIAEVDKSKSNRVGVKLADGSWMGCFDSKLWPRLEVGAALNVEVKTSERNGRTYRNITGILGTAPSANGAHPASDRERNIVRESALRAACDIAAFVAHDGEDIVTSILAAADRFAAWIERSEEEEGPF